MDKEEFQENQLYERFPKIKMPYINASHVPLLKASDFIQGVQPMGNIVGIDTNYTFKYVNIKGVTT